ncbi:PH domain-containing protein [Nocardiopsis sp. MG754419]|uniref:PH domain-containing protein n=1 Tax=Nocardiopsis sp. MG754419 TaxID=2259865 RepID=UPI001BA91407|nr:PH domain-containing protein [Nocardiopsis sp. MG754419]MBR8741597.1 PH domain-containing protein [Nocardiopsis sp. MG754419]
MDEASMRPETPRTWRPRAVRWVAYALGALIVGTMVVLAVILPVEWRALDRVLVVGLGLAIAAGLHMLARPRLIATERNVIVINGIRTHYLAWPEVLDIRMPVGEPWPSLDLSDGTSLPVMGIQSTDGDLARRNLEEFRAMLGRGEASEPERPA